MGPKMSLSFFLGIGSPKYWIFMRRAVSTSAFGAGGSTALEMEGVRGSHGAKLKGSWNQIWVSQRAAKLNAGSNVDPLYSVM
jgi:hypothetical protein